MKTNLLQKNIPKGWEIKKIKDLLDFEQPTKYIVESSSYTLDGKTPVLTANKSFVLGYTNETDGVYTKTPAIIFDDFTTDSKYVDFPFKIKSSAIKILTNRDEDTDLKFVYEIMKSFNFPIANHKRHYISQYQELDIVVPSTKEQKKIADILSSVDEEIQKAEEMISATEKLKRGLVKDLFTKGIGHKKFKKTKNGEIPEDWKILELGDICKFTQGVQIPYSEQIKESKPGYIRYLYIRDFFTDDFACYVQDIYPDKIMNLEDIMMVNTGNTAGRVYSGVYGVLSNNAFKFSFEKKVLNRDFLYQFLTSKYFQDYIYKLSNHAGQPHVGHKNIARATIALPRLEEQERIVSILSSIDKKITTSKELRAKLSEIKKGLVSDLLSGKVRTINS